MALEPKNSAFRERVQLLFESAAFVRDLGIRVERVEPGEVETSLVVAARHGQQDGVVHAGVMATLADHTAGGAAASLVSADETILSIEFKINLLRPAVGERLRCIARVLRPGRTLHVVESEISSQTGQNQRLVSKATVTLAVVHHSHLRPGP